MTHTNNPIVTRGDKQAPVLWSELDSNFKNLARYAGDWVDPSPDGYAKNQIVHHQGGTYVSLVDNNQEEPLGVQWEAIPAYPGQGSMYLGTPPVAESDLSGAFIPITAYDSVDLVTRGIAFDTALGTFTYTWKGIWDWVLYLNISHNEQNQSRSSIIRLYNVTTGTPGEGVPWYIARNQNGSAFSIPVRQTIGDGELNQVWRLELGGGDTVTSVAYQALSLDFTQMSAF